MDPATTLFLGSEPAVTTTTWTNASAVRPMPRSHGVLGSVENLPMTWEIPYLQCNLMPGEKYRIRSLLQGSSDTLDHAGLIIFEGAEGGEGLAASETLGPYMYLRSGPGVHRTDRVIAVNRPVSRIGLRRGGLGGPPILRTLTIERVDQNKPTSFFVSFDVEAMPGRAAGTNKIDALVWGRFGGQEYGIRRICDILDQHSAKGSFLIEFGTCSNEGEGPLREIIDFLGNRGHEVHLHLHADRLFEYWGLRPRQRPLTMDQLSYEMSRRVLDFTVAKYERFVGKPPRVFRCGGLRVNKNIVAAAAALGIEALSNVRWDMVGDPSIKGDSIDAWEPFVWDNGVLELPIDFNCDPLSTPFENYSKRYDNTVYKKPGEKIFQVLLHSWSLMRLNEENFYEVFEPEHEKRLHQILTHMQQLGRLFGFNEYLDSHRLSRPVRPMYHLRSPQPEPTEYVDSPDIVRCNICDATFATRIMVGDVCPGCGSERHHRQLNQVVSTYGSALEGHRVLAFDHERLQQWGLLAGAKSSRPIRSTADLGDLAAHSVDAVIGLNLIARQGDADVTSMVARVLKPGGVFVSMTSYTGDSELEHEHVPDAPFTYDEYVTLLSTHFESSSVPGFDSVTGVAARVFIARTRD
jgi:hypothetical protein